MGNNFCCFFVHTRGGERWSKPEDWICMCSQSVAVMRPNAERRGKNSSVIYNDFERVENRRMQMEKSCCNIIYLFFPRLCILSTTAWFPLFCMSTRMYQRLCLCGYSIHVHVSRWNRDQWMRWMSTSSSWLDKKNVATNGKKYHNGATKVCGLNFFLYHIPLPLSLVQLAHFSLSRFTPATVRFPTDLYFNVQKIF